MGDVVYLAGSRALPPTKSRLLVKRGGNTICSKVPKPLVLVDTREQRPFSFAAHPNWIKGEKRATLPVADYSVEGMESLLALERKSLEDVVGSLVGHREQFLAMCEKLADYRWKGIIIEASYEDIKSPYPSQFSTAHPNGITGSLDAIEAKYGIPIIYTSRFKNLAEEKAASWLSKHFTYWWLESNGMGRVLLEGDL